MLRKKIKITIWLVFSFCMLMTQSLSVLAQSPAIVHVEAPTGVHVDPNDKWAIGTTRPTDSGYSSSYYSKLSINGQKVYCLQPLSSIANGNGGYTAMDLASYFGNAALTKKLEWISSLGYGYMNDKTMEMDYATQIRIWQEITPGLITNIHPEIQSKIDLINQRLHVMETPVSFQGQDIVLYGYGEEFAQTLNDQNHVFENYILDQSTLKMERNGNQVRVWLDKEDGLQGSASMHCFYVPQGTSIAYKNPYGYQEVGYITGGSSQTLRLNAHVRLGSIQITKGDQETGTRAQGEATLVGAQYSVIDDKTGKQIGTLTIQNDLQSNILDQLPSDRTYSIKEIKAPKGYQLNTKIITADVKAQQDVRLSVTDSVVTGRFQLKKIITDASTTEIVKPEANAQFGVVLKKYVDQYGSVQEALKHKDTFTNHEWDLLHTDEKGNATSRELAYGTYLIQQLTREKETDILKEPFTFTVDENEREPMEYTINNRPSDYYLRLVKKDKDTKKEIAYSGAKFQIFDQNDQKVTMKIGPKIFDTFETASNSTKEEQGIFVAKEEKGKVTIPLKLKAGRYRIEEKVSPKGYLLLSKTVWVDIGEDFVSEKDSQEDAYVEVVIENEKPTATIELQKEFEEPHPVETCPQEVLFVLRAKEDILDPSDGSVLYHANEKINVGSAKEGIYALGKDQVLRIENLPIGLGKTVYQLEEIQTKEGYKLADKPIDFVFTAKDNMTKSYKVSKTLQNEKLTIDTSVQPNGQQKKTFNGNQDFMIRDTIFFQDLDAQKTYRLKGTIIDRTTQKPVKVNEKELIHEISFVPDHQKGFVDNSFWIEKQSLPKGKYVVFEELYCDKGHLLAEHKDENDENQSFEVELFYEIEVEKIDAKSEKTITNQDFEFTLYEDSSCTKQVQVGQTDLKKGMSLFKEVTEGVWYLKETRAPKGYQLEKNVQKIEIRNHEVWIDGKQEKMEKSCLHIKVKNEKQPSIPTGKSMHFVYALWFFLSGFLGCMIVFLQWMRRKRV